MMLRKCPAKKNKEKRIKRKRNVKVETAASLVKPKTLEVLFSVHTLTPNFGSWNFADILHLEQKAAKYLTYYQRFGEF